MHLLYQEFITYLDREEKESCVQLVLDNLRKKTVDIVTLYNEILTPALYADFCTNEKQEMCIWAEHVRTSIVRTIIECSYPYIMMERKEKYGSTVKGEAFILCPSGELHEIGARMVSDFFTLCGYKAEFAGANTPEEDIIKAIKYIRPKYVAISITNNFNMVAGRNLVQNLLNLKPSLSFQIIIGGQACYHNREVCQQIGSDMVLESFKEIQALAKEQDIAAT